MELLTRQNFVNLIDEKGYKIGAEVGVRYGGFSDFLLKYSKLDLLYSIDPWEVNCELSNNQDACDIHYINCQKLLSKHGQRSKIIRAYSPQVCNQFKPNSLDFLYIDALHDYKSVKADNENWWSIIKKGGCMAGHDFDRNEWPGVVQAVEEFTKEYNLTYELTGIGDTYAEGDGLRQSWYIFKPIENQV